MQLPFELYNKYFQVAMNSGKYHLITVKLNYNDLVYNDCLVIVNIVNYGTVIISVTDNKNLKK